MRTMKAASTARHSACSASVAAGASGCGWVTTGACDCSTSSAAAPPPAAHHGRAAVSSASGGDLAAAVAAHAAAQVNAGANAAPRKSASAAAV
jgi:hypothetical protein